MLWRDTATTAHNRSVICRQNTIVTPANSIVDLNFFLTECMSSTTGAEFWKTAGGAQDPSFGVTPSWMNPNGTGTPAGVDPITIVIRGGRLWATMANTDTQDNVTVNIQLLFVKGALRDTTDTTDSNTAQAYLTAIGTGPRPKSWTPQMAPDYSEYFYKPVLSRTVDLQPGQDVTVWWKIKPVKIDVAPFKRGGGNWFPVWYFSAMQNINNTTGGATVNVSAGHNISFSVTDMPQ